MFTSLDTVTPLRHESPHAHHHKVATRLVERQHIPVLYIPEPAQGEGPVCIDVQVLRDHGSNPVDQQEISRKTRIISILVRFAFLLICIFLFYFTPSSS